MKQDNTNILPLAVRDDQVLIAYFSHSGNTRTAAKNIQTALGCNVDLFDIKPVKDYPANYNACVSQAKRECSNQFKPELQSTLDNIDKYEYIFVGTPNWWHTIAPPVLTFLSTYNFNDKVIIPFITHGGGGIANCQVDMQKVCPDSKYIKPGVFYGNINSKVRDEIMKWINEIMTINK